MPRKPRKSSLRSTNLKPYELAFLLDDDSYCRPNIPRDLVSLSLLRQGHPGLLFGDKHPKDLWTEHGAEAFAIFIEANPGKRPVGWWLYEAPEPRDSGESEPDYLRRHGLLTAGEKTWLKKPVL